MMRCTYFLPFAYHANRNHYYQYTVRWTPDVNIFWFVWIFFALYIQPCQYYRPELEDNNKENDDDCY